MRHHVSERVVIPALSPVDKAPATTGIAQQNEAAQHRNYLLGASSRMQQQQQLELERMRALRAAHPLNPSPTLIGALHGRRGPFLTYVASFRLFAYTLNLFRRIIIRGQCFSRWCEDPCRDAREQIENTDLWWLGLHVSPPPS